MATELGQAYVQIMPSAKGISGAIQKQINPEASAAGESAGGLMGGKLVSVIKGVIATAAIGKAISSSLMEGANLQQSIGGIETLFKDSADKVIKNADMAYKTAGLSANDYMESVTSFSASLLQAVGGDTDKAADKANTALIDMSDNANKMGSNMEDIQNAYQGFAKQNYTMLDNLKLGYGGTKEEMSRLLKDATKLTGVKYDINNLADVYDAIHAVQGQLDITGTTAKESAETFSGSLASMKSAFSNVLGNLSLGRDIGPSLNALAETVSTFLFKNLIPMVGNILKTLPGAVVTFIKAMVPSIQEGMGQLVNGLISGLNGLGGNLGTTFQDAFYGDGVYSAILYTLNDSLALISEKIPEFLSKGVEIINGIVNGIISESYFFFNGMTSILTSVMGFITAQLPSFLNAGIEILTNLANGILQKLPDLITVAGRLISNFSTFLMTNIPVILEAGKNLILNLADGIISNLPAIGNSAIQAVSNFIDVILANYPQYLQSGRSILKSLVQGILERLPDLISAAFTLIKNFASMLISKLPDIIGVGVKLLLSLVSGIITSIPDLLSAVANIGSTIREELGKIDLWEAGKAIINGLLGGFKEAYEGVKNFIGGIGSWIAEHKGPISYDRKLLIPAGNAIMAGLDEGLRDKFRSVQNTISSMTDEMVTGLSPKITASRLATSAYQIQAAEPNQGTASNSDIFEISIPLNVDGRRFAMATGRYTWDEIKKMQRNENRKRGSIS